MTPRTRHIGHHPPRLRGPRLAAILAVAVLLGALLLPRGVMATRLDGERDLAGPVAAVQAAVTRVERDRTGRCIPAEPHLTPACSDAEAALWENRGGALSAQLEAELGRAPTAEEVAAAQVERRARAGDLAAIATLAAAHGGPELRVVAVGLSADPAAEYVELENLGLASASLTMVARPNRDAPAELVLRVIPAAPGGVGYFFLDDAVLAPGGRCRLYSLEAGQDDTCPGLWLRPSAGPRWPERAGWALLYGSPPCRLTGPGRTPCDTTVYELDRWHYRNDEGGMMNAEWGHVPPFIIPPSSFLSVSRSGLRGLRRRRSG